MRPIATLAFLLALALPAAADDPAPSTAPAPAAPSDAEREEIKRLVDELRGEAARLRGLAWKEEVPADLLSRAQLRENMAKSMREEIPPEELERDVRIARRLGLLGPDEDPIALFLDVLEHMVGGYYDPTTRRLYLVEGMTGEAQKPVILHELVHALEDQHIDLKARTDRVKEDYDRVFVEKCLQEGSAEHASNLYQAAHPEVAERFQREQADPSAAATQIRILSQMPAFLVLGTLLWYQLGPTFVARGVRADYPGGIAALYESPPVSQEQILHPDKWYGARQDWPHAIEWAADLASAAGEGWTPFHAHPKGQLDLALHLDRWLGPLAGKMNLILMARGLYATPSVTAAARGWDGGQSVYLAKEGLPLAWAEALAFDTPRDAGEAADAMRTMLQKASGEAFSGGEWATADDGSRTASFEGAFGPGRIRQNGSTVVLLEGVPAESFDRVWEVVAATRFVRDARDAFDPAVDRRAVAESHLVVEEHGVGVNRPDETWTLERATTGRGAVARLGKDGVDVEIRVLDQDQTVSLGQALQGLEVTFKAGHPDADLTRRRDVPVGPTEGVVYPLGPRRGGPEDRHTTVYVGAREARIFVVRAEGPPEPLERLSAELDQIAAGIRSAGELGAP
jgi:hypothetical protein